MQSGESDKQGRSVPSSVDAPQSPGAWLPSGGLPRAHAFPHTCLFNAPVRQTPGEGRNPALAAFPFRQRTGKTVGDEIWQREGPRNQAEGPRPSLSQTSHPRGSGEG